MREGFFRQRSQYKLKCRSETECGPYEGQCTNLGEQKEIELARQGGAPITRVVRQTIPKRHNKP